MEKRIYRFGHDECGADVTEGTAHDNYTLGGKGANLAEMARIGLPVPPGFTITCQTCMDYARGGNAWPAGTLEAIAEARATSSSVAASAWETRPTRCSSPCAPAPPSPCPA